MHETYASLNVQTSASDLPLGGGTRELIHRASSQRGSRIADRIGSRRPREVAVWIGSDRAVPEKLLSPCCEAETEARFYAAAIGRIPAFLFRDLDTVWIHCGTFAFGGGNRNLLIHTEQGQAYVATGSLECAKE